MGQVEKLDVTYQNLSRRMIKGGILEITMCIGDNDVDFRYKLNNEKVHVISFTFDVSSVIQKHQKNYAGHVVRMPIERYEEQLMFNDDKYHSIRRVTPSLLEQVLKFK